MRRRSCSAWSICAASSCQSSISPSRLGFPPTEPTARHAIIVVEFGRQVAGLLVDGVSDIFTASEEQIQPTPDIAAETAKLYVRGVIAMDGRLIAVIDIANLLPSPELAAA